MTVSICMITYNHESFIAQAIEGILMQETDFPFELVIGEDHSTDSTLSICREYSEKFPGKIRLITSPQNVGMTANFLRTYRACQGTYIAFCEGDDYWTDKQKLQKQANFLSENPLLSSCFHNVILKRQRNNEFSEWPLHEKPLPRKTFGTADVLGPWFIPSPSFMFRNYPDFEIPDWFHNCKYGDLPFMLLLTLRGEIGYIDEIMAVYRLHDTGMTTKFANYDKIMIMIYIYCNFDIYTQFAYHAQIRNSVEYEILRELPMNKYENPGTPTPENRFGKLRRVARKLLRL